MLQNCIDHAGSKLCAQSYSRLQLLQVSRIRKVDTNNSRNPWKHGDEMFQLKVFYVLQCWTRRICLLWSFVLCNRKILIIKLRFAQDYLYYIINAFSGQHKMIWKWTRKKNTTNIYEATLSNQKNITSTLKRLHPQQWKLLDVNKGSVVLRVIVSLC